jgi:5,6-dimethylbenzimidazole synthase
MVAFDEAFRRKLQELFVWRRDVRRFRRDSLPEGAIEQLIETVCLSPSVGLSQPWRFVIVEDALRRRAVIEDFKTCNADALRSYSGERAAHYATLKLAGLEDAPGHLAVVAAISSMWLAARAEGIGLGWVSILNPARINDILDVPISWKFIGYLCLGYPQVEDDRPDLERAKWECRRAADEFTVRR